MKKLFFLISVMALAFSCSVDNNRTSAKIDNGPAKAQWSRTYNGSDETVPQYPDLYSHYWQYVWSMKDNPDMVLKVHGAFPHARYFSFSLYNDTDGSAINGMSDFEIIPDQGSVNPFVVTSDKENTFTIFIARDSICDAIMEKFGQNANVIKVDGSVEQANIMIRQYMSVDQDGNPDEYGGVDMPAIQAFLATTWQEIKTPATLDGNVNSNIPPFQERAFDTLDDVPFMLSPHGSFYPNNATDYLYARTCIKDDQVLTFSFLPAPCPKRSRSIETPRHATGASVWVRTKTPAPITPSTTSRPTYQMGRRSPS